VNLGGSKLGPRKPLPPTGLPGMEQRWASHRESSRRLIHYSCPMGQEQWISHQVDSRLGVWFVAGKEFARSPRTEHELEHCSLTTRADTQQLFESRHCTMVAAVAVSATCAVPA